MSEYTTPEIQRNSLDSVLLQMIAMGLPDVRKFPFIEPPNSDSIESSLIALKQHVRMMAYLLVHLFVAVERELGRKKYHIDSTELLLLHS